MRLTTTELGVVALLIAYVAFYTHPTPPHIADFLSSSVGKVLGLLGVLYVTVYQSTIVGIFLAVAYLMSLGSTTEYMDPKEQKPAAKEPEQPKSKGVAPPAVTGALKSMLTKGDTRLPQIGQKKGTPATKPATTSPVKPSASAGVEKFANFY